MITSVRLKNFKSFGAAQSAPLEAITVLVGANNSGKSNFLSFVDVIRRPGVERADFHRPPTGDGVLEVEWDVELPPKNGQSNPRLATWSLRAASETSWTETVTIDGAQVLSNPWGRTGALATFDGTSMPPVRVYAPTFAQQSPRHRLGADLGRLVMPVVGARDVHLSIEALRKDSSAGSALQRDGSNLAGLVAAWRMGDPERMDEFDAIIQRCLPEMKRVLAHPAPNKQVRLLFEQRDGEKFDVSEVSDGVLVFAGLVAHVLTASPGALVLVEEPERGVHPRRLADFVDLLRTLVKERGVQFLMATNSPALLNLFRDEPEAILMLRRTPEGTSVKRLSDVDALVEALARADPGELLANGVFSEAFGT